MSARRARLVRALPYFVAAAAAACLYYAALQFSFHHRPGTLGPNAWPLGVSLLMLVVSGGKAVEALVRRPPPSTEYEEIAAADTGDAAPPESHPWLLLAGMAVTLAYVALVTPVGFLLCTAAYLAIFLWIGGYRRLAPLAAMSVLGSLVLMFVFMKLVYVSLPIGEPPFSAAMLALMQLMGIR